MAEDWLPHEPPPQTPPRHSAKRTLAIWLVLIVMFLAIYAMFDSNPHARAAKAVAGYSGWWIAIAAVAGLMLPILVMVWLFHGAEAFNAHQAAGLEAIADGDYARAVPLFAALTKRYQLKPNFAAVAAYNHGYALLRGGDSAAAVGILLGVDRMAKVAAGGVRRMAATQLARAFALGGDLDKANRWLEAVRARPPVGDHAYCKALLDAVDGLVLCRQGRFEDAVRHYERCWSHLEAYLPVHQMSEAWLLRAFAITLTSGPRDSGAAEPWLRMIRGMPPGSFAWLTARWPELATFTTTHGLAAAEVEVRDRAAAAPAEA